MFIICDGAGGQNRGEEASQTVMEVLADLVGRELPRRDNGRWYERGGVGRAVCGAIRAANQELISMATADPARDGMGATTVIGVLACNTLLFCSVGDSRAYLHREHQLRQLTVDDTLVQGLVEAGALTPGEAARHPLRRALLHSVGTCRLEKRLRLESCPLQPGDRLLFTSAGLLDALEQDQLAAALDDSLAAAAAAEQLVSRAADAGGRDNASCIVVDLFA